MKFKYGKETVPFSSQQVKVMGVPRTKMHTSSDRSQRARIDDTPSRQRRF